MNCAVEAELPVLVGVAESFFGARQIVVSGLGKDFGDARLLFRCQHPVDLYRLTCPDGLFQVSINGAGD